MEAARFGISRITVTVRNGKLCLSMVMMFAGVPCGHV